MKLTPSLRDHLVATARALPGAERRLFQARTVREWGRGGQALAERELGWCRATIRKGAHELRSGLRCLDNFAGRGRKRAEEHLPHLLEDIKALVDEQSQPDPQFKSKRLYTRLSGEEVRRQLILQKGYQEEELPTAATLRAKLNQLGYHPTRVNKSRPQKRSRKPTLSSSS